MSQDTNAVLQLSKNSINIRMYDLQNGQGDCLLIRFLDDNDSPFNILIDCGSFWRTAGANNMFEKVVEDIAKITQDHINILIITHEHWDHLSGFDFAKEKFKQIMVDELWVAWTENVEGDELAEALHDKYESELNALSAITAKLQAARDPWAKPINALLSLSKNSDRVMDNILETISSNPPRFCNPQEPPITIPGLSNLRFYIIAPHKNKGKLTNLRAEKAIHGEPLLIDEATSLSTAVLSSFGKKKLNSKERLKNKYLTNYCLPFDPKYGLTKKAAISYRINDELFFEGYCDPNNPENNWRNIKDDWLYSAGNLALQIDSYTNNTSLVMAIEMLNTGKVLLFTGDAESENWETWKECNWTFNDPNGHPINKTGDQLIGSTGLYKVAHHGSENGTVQNILESMNADLIAMIPVNRKKALDKKGWDHPNESVYTEIIKQTKGRVIRADERIPATKHPELSLDKWNAFKNNVYGSTRNIKDLWIEYRFS